MANKLLHEAMAQARRYGIQQLELSVNAANSAAISFYERHGFAEVGRIPNGFRASDRETDELIMVLGLMG